MDTPNDTPPQDIDKLYEAMQPRFVAARRRYMHRRLGVLLLTVPLVLGVSLAFASQRDEPSVSQLASGAPESTEKPVVEKPVVEDTGQAEEPAATTATESDVETPTEAEVETEKPAAQQVSLGIAGTAHVRRVGDGVELAEVHLNDGWKAEELGFGNKAAVVLILANGDVRLTATIFFDGEGEARAKLDDVSPEPEPEVQRRKEIAVGDVGTVVVERDGDKLWIGVTWSHDWWKDVVVVEVGPEVHAYFTNDGIEKHVEAWIDGAKIAHRIWVDDSKVEPKDEPKDEPKEEPKVEPKDEPAPEVQRRKEIAVSEVGTVVVERDGKKLWLGVTWSHQWWDDIVVVEHGTEVHAYFTNDGFEHHVRAWIKGTKIKHETWVVEPKVAAYDGWVSCGFGDIGVLVEGNVARVMTVNEVEGVTTTVLTEVGEVVRIRFVTAEATWILEAWGNGEQVVSECGQVE